MSASTPPAIGVVGAPDVAAALTEIGLKVYTGATFRTAAAAIIQQLNQGQPFPIVVETLNEVAFDRWVATAHQRSNGQVILLPTNPDVDLVSNEYLQGVPTLPLPATVNDLLVRLGGAPAISPAGQTVIQAESAAPEPVAEYVAPAPVAAPAAAVVVPDISDPLATAPAVGQPLPQQVVPAVPDPFPAPAVTDPFPVPTVTDAFPTEAPAPAIADPFVQAAQTPSFPVPDITDPFAQAAAPQVPTLTDPFAGSAPAAPVFDPTAGFPSPVAQPEFPAPTPVATPEPFVAPAPVAQPEPVVAPEPAQQFPGQAQPFVAPEPVAAQAPAWGAQPTWSPEPAPAPAPATADFFGGAGAAGSHCKILFSVAAKGGVGKTTQTLMYGQTAGMAGLRVLVIDGNRDQGDINASLRVEKTGLPTILHAINHGPEAAIVTKDQLNAVRAAGKQQIEFDVVFAPHREFAGPQYASAEVYASVLSYAKPRYDLIVLDTQIVEAQKSDLFEGFIIPELRAGAWSAGIAQYNYAAVRNAFAAFDELNKLGVGRDRSLVLASKWPADDADPAKFQEKFGQYGTFVGFLAEDASINRHMSSGNILTGSPAVAEVNKAVLYHVTGNPAFAPSSAPAAQGKGKAAAKPKRSLFGGRR